MGPRQIKRMRVRTENCWWCKSTVEICMYVDDSKKRPWGATSSFHASLDHTTTYYGVLDFFGYVLLICLKETGRIAWLPKLYPYTLPYLSHSPSIFCLYRQELFLQLRDTVLTWEQQQHIYIEKTRLKDSNSQAGLGKQDEGSQYPTPEWGKHPFLSDKWNKNRERAIVHKCVKQKYSKIFFFSIYSFNSLIYSNGLIRSGNQTHIEFSKTTINSLTLLSLLLPLLHTEVLWVATDTAWQLHINAANQPWLKSVIQRTSENHVLPPTLHR